MPDTRWIRHYLLSNPHIAWVAVAKGQIVLFKFKPTEATQERKEN